MNTLKHLRNLTYCLIKDLEKDPFVKSRKNCSYFLFQDQDFFSNSGSFICNLCDNLQNFRKIVSAVYKKNYIGRAGTRMHRRMNRLTWAITKDPVQSNWDSKWILLLIKHKRTSNLILIPWLITWIRSLSLFWGSLDIPLRGREWWCKIDFSTTTNDRKLKLGQDMYR